MPQPTTKKGLVSLCCAQKETCALLLCFLARPVPLTVMAVHPRLRFAVEARHGVKLPCGTLQIVTQSTTTHTQHCLTLSETHLSYAALSATQWWVAKCDLPVKLSAPSLTGQIALDHAFFRRLSELQLSPRVTRVDVGCGVESSLASANLGMAALRSVAAHPCQFYHLRTLTVHDVEEHDALFLSQFPNLDSVAACGDFRAVHTEFMPSPSTVTALEMQSGRLTAVPPLTPFTALHTLTLLYCPQLTSVSSVAQCGSTFTKLSLSRCGVQDLAPLASCRRLRDLDLSASCAVEEISSLSALAGLRSLNISWTAVSSLEPLRACTELASLRLCRCANVRDLSSLAGAPSLQHLDARMSGVEVLNGLHTCPMLSVVDFAGCESLTSISALGGAPALKEIHAACSSVHTLSGLEACPQLAHADFADCNALRSFAHLSSTPRLRFLDGSNTMISEDELGELWPSLEHIDLSGAEHLHSIPAKWTAPHLRSIDLSLSAVQHLAGLRNCPRLIRVDCALCVQLCDISALASAPSLETLDLKGSAIVSIEALSCCLQLRKVDVSECVCLSDLSPLRNAALLKEVSADGCGAVSLDAR